MFNAELNFFKTYSEAPALQDEYVFFFQKYLKPLTIFFPLVSHKDFESVMRKHPADHRKREKRNIAPNPTAGTVTLQQIHQEINNKFIEVCNSSDRICQAGPPGSAEPLGIPDIWEKKGPLKR